VRESTKSDAEGRFAFKATLPGDEPRDHLAVLARDQEGRLDWASSDPGQTWGKLRLMLTPAHAVSGRVLDEAGNPLKGVMLELAGLSRAKMEHDSGANGLFAPPELKLRCQATTTAAGEFTIPGIPGEGNVWVRIARPGEIPRNVQWDLGNPVDLPLVNAGTLSILLTADDPQAGANRDVVVRLTQTQGKQYRFNYYSNPKTDAEGNLRLEGLPPGDYSILVGQEPIGPRWYADDEIKAEVASGATSEVVMKLRPGVTVAGAVVDAETKRGVPGVRVDIGNLVTTDDDGRYQGFVKPGMVSIGIEKVSDEYSRPFERQQSESGDKRFLEIAPIELLRSIPVNGVVVDDAGKPVPGALVYVTSFELLGSRPPLTTDDAGRFTVKGLPPDDAFTLHAFSENGVNQGGWTVIPERQEGEVQLRVAPKTGFRIRSRVVNEQGQPMADVPVRIGWNRPYSSRHEGSGRTGSFLPPILTDAEGRFESRLLWPEDRYDAQVIVAGYEILELPGTRSDQQWVGRPPETLEVPDLVLKKEK
jgi:protocatechuate 3,4-dioxygenase beta subunit